MRKINLNLTTFENGFLNGNGFVDMLKMWQFAGINRISIEFDEKNDCAFVKFDGESGPQVNINIDKPIEKVAEGPSKPSESDPPPRQEEPAKVAEKSSSKPKTPKKPSLKNKPSEPVDVVEGFTTDYDGFCLAVEKDDGGDMEETLTTIANRLSLDDILQINNDYGIGLDTDQSLDALRTEIVGSFLQ